MLQRSTNGHNLYAFSSFGDFTGKKDIFCQSKKLAYFQINTMYAFVLLKVSVTLYNCTLSMKNEASPSRVIVFMSSYPVESKYDKRF